MEISLEKNELKDDKKINEIKIIYKSPNNNSSKTKIFGYKFVDNNKDNCKIIFNNKQYDLVEELNLENINKIKLTRIKGITDMSYMFYKCDLLLSLPDIDKMDTSQVIDMSYLFDGCKSLLYLPDISKWNTSKVTKINFLFGNCISLSYIPNIGKWDISSVKDISHMFLYCTSLINLPDISNWNTTKIEYMYDICEGCISLSALPDISKWKLENIVTNIQILYNYNSTINCLKNSIDLFNNHFSIKYNKRLEKLFNESEMDKEEILEIYNLYEDNLYISSFIEEIKVIKKIIEYKGDKNKILNYIETMM